LSSSSVDFFCSILIGLLLTILPGIGLQASLVESVAIVGGSVLNGALGRWISVAVTKVGSLSVQHLTVVGLISFKDISLFVVGVDTVDHSFVLHVFQYDYQRK